MKKFKTQPEDLKAIRKELLQDLQVFLKDLDAAPEKYLEPINFTRRYTIAVDGQKQIIYFTPEAYLQMLEYTLKSSKEIAWHGLVTKHDNHSYLITKCMLYPQTVTAATVTTDQEKYNEWLENLDDDTVNHMRFQGHSHVNMGVTPSSVDMGFYEDLVANLPKDDFYIFLIINKSQAIHALIYDRKTNIIYENTDIEVVVLDSENEQMLDDIDVEIKENITEHTYSYGSGGTYGFGREREIVTPQNPDVPDYQNEGYWDKFYDELERDYPGYHRPQKIKKKGGKKK